MATCDVDQLMADGKCFTCLEPKQMQAVLLQLICELQETIDILIAAIPPAPTPDLGPTVEDLVYAAAIDVDLDGADYQRVALAGDIDFSATLNRPATGYAKAVAIIITADGSDRNLTFNANWTCVGTAPTQTAAGKVGVLSITALGPAETDVIYAYQEEA